MPKRGAANFRTARRPTATEDLRSLRVVSSPRVSPDGERIAFVCRDIDEKRPGITGRIYGGLMTNRAISHSVAYAVAVTDRCVSNPVSMFGTTDFPEIPGQYWPGISWDRADERREHSPLKHFSNVKRPTLMIHSEGNLRYSIEPPGPALPALELQRLPARFVRYPASPGSSRGHASISPAGPNLSPRGGAWVKRAGESRR